MHQVALPLDHLVAPDTVLGALSRHIGAGNGIHARALAQLLAGPLAGPAVERRIRAVITELRLQGAHVCGTPETGYFMAASADELDLTCLFLHERAMTTLTQIARMRQVAVPDLRGQLRLPT